MTLRNGDLRDLVYHILEIDSYKSKMGSDEDIITLSFSAKTKESADDLADFIEKGYDFVLDADATPGEQSDGTYKVFVEIERERGAAQNITELSYGISELTGLDNLKFRYYKDWKSQPLDEVSLEAAIPVDRDNYGMKVNESNLNNYSNFFNKSFLESVDMFDNILRIKKAWAEPVFFQVIEFGNKTEILNNLSESLNVNEWAEIIFLTKYIGDYDITKYGDKIVVENNRKVLVAKRIVT